MLELSLLTRRGQFIAMAAVLVASLVAGCTSAVNDEGTGTDGTPTPGGVLNIVQSADVSPTTLMAQNNPNMSINRLVFNYLVELDHETLEPQPSLATAWTVSDDGTSITFELRDDVTFHDGRKFTADDVIASVQVMQRPDVPSQLKHVANLVTDMTKSGDFSVTLTLSQAVSNLFDLFEMMPIIDIDTVDGLFDGTEFNGTGPFVVDDYNPSQGMTLSKNDSYWKDDLPYLDGVTVTVVRNSQSMLSSLRSGQSQLALDLAPLDASSLRSAPDFTVVEADAQDSTFYLASNVTNPLLADKEVRQAISYSIDRERILDQVLGGIGSVTSLPWSPASSAYDDSRLGYYAYDPEKAKSLIDELGAAGSPVNVYYDAGFAPAAGIAEIVQFNLEEAGLTPTAAPLQSSDFLDKLRNGGLDGLFVSGHGFGQLHPATLLKGAFPFNADNNASLFDSQEYKDLANRVWTTTDEADAAAVIDEVNAFLLDQQFVSDLVNSSHTFSISNDLHGLSWTMFDYIDLDEAYLD